MRNNIFRFAFAIILILHVCPQHSHAAARYVFFLHNMYLELFPNGELHTDYGRCEYETIITAFQKRGFTVISELRLKGTGGVAYAQKVAAQADSLIQAGTPPSHITIVGTSKGGYIAQHVSGLLKNRDINFVFIGCCDADINENPQVGYCGNILSIYENTDKWVSCQNLVQARGTNVGRFREIMLQTNLKHGYLYKALDKWIEPATSWARGYYNFKWPAISWVTQIDSLLASPAPTAFKGIVMIAQKGAIRYAACQGYSDIEQQIPLRFTNEFIIGSISKQITAVLVLREYDKGRLQLDAPVSYYLPQLKYKWTDAVTVHHLLTHTHGIDEEQPDKPLKFKPGTAYEYSQAGYDLLAQIVEETSGKTYSRLSQELFALCGMSHSFHPDIYHDTNLTRGYMEVAGKGLQDVNKIEKYIPPVAAGRFISNAEDMERWNHCLHSGKLLSARSYKKMITPQKNAVRQHPLFGTTYYGYGITVENKNNILQLGQTGLLPGYVSMNYYFPQADLHVVILANTLYTQGGIHKTFSYHTAILDIVKKSKLVKK